MRSGDTSASMSVHSLCSKQYKEKTIHGIDISNWKADFNPDRVPFDFLVAQTTWGAGEFTGNGIVHGVWVGADAKIQRCVALGKPFGYMHYIRGVGAEAEARFFAANTLGYVHRGLPCVDWEAADNLAWNDVGYLDRFLGTYIALTRVKPLVYVQQSAMSAVAGIAAAHDCGLWVAQYADDASTGYQLHPWNEDAYGCAMRQYSSHGRLPGYAGDLDLNVFYGDRTAWNKYVMCGA